MTNLKSLILIIFLILSSVGLHSCWFPCAPGISGTVIDNVTDKPIDSVKIDFFEEGIFVETIFSDSIGRFWANTESESVFMTSKCERDFSLLITKDGYDTLKYNDVAPSVNIEIRLKK